MPSLNVDSLATAVGSSMTAIWLSAVVICDALNDANAYTPVSISIKIDEGETLRLGIRKQSTESADWVAYDNFQLFYVENLTDVKNISVEHTSDDVYDIQGRLVRKNSNLTGIPKGVYIINGNKILVK